MAVASDLNPGTSPFASLRLASETWRACFFGLTPGKHSREFTREVAKRSRADRLGTLEAGKQADFLVWDATHPAEIMCQLGVNLLRERVFRGRVAMPEPDMSV